MGSGPYSTRRAVWEQVNTLLGGNYVSWRYFEILCMKGKGPKAALRYGRRCLYAPTAAQEFIDSYMRPGDATVTSQE